MPGTDRDSGAGSGRRPVRRRASQRPRTPLERLKDAFTPSGGSAPAGQPRYAPHSPPPAETRRYTPAPAPTPSRPPVRPRQSPPAVARAAQRSPRRTHGGGRRFSLPPMSRRLIAVIVAGFLLAGLGGTGAYFSPLLVSALQDTGHSGPTPPPAHSGIAPAGGGTATTSGAFTVLLMGSDNDGKQGNNQTPLTQTMILVRVDPQTNRVAMLSLPRDLWVQLYNSSGDSAGTNKLDVSFTGGTFPSGAAQAAVNTVQTDFHVQINDWAWIGLQGLVNLIDYVGGVDVVVTSPVMDDLYPADVGTQNAYGYQRLAITPGPQHMNGQQALDYVRSRHQSSYGDFSRSARQQQVLVALRDKLKNLSAADLPKLSNALQGQVETNLSLPQIAGLLPLARSVNNSNIAQITLAAPQYTTAETLSDGDQILQPNMAAIESEIWKYFPQSQ